MFDKKMKEENVVKFKQVKAIKSIGGSFGSSVELQTSMGMLKVSIYFKVIDKN